MLKTPGPSKNIDAHCSFASNTVSYVRYSLLWKYYFLNRKVPIKYNFQLFPKLLFLGYLTIEMLNKRIKKINYGPDNCANIPPPISARNLKNKKKKQVKMNAAEMFNFSQNFTFLIGDLIPVQSEDMELLRVWEFVKNIMKMVDVCYLPWYETEDLVQMKTTIKFVLQDYLELGEGLKPKFHYLTHYPTNTERYGPMRYLQTIR